MLTFLELCIAICSLASLGYFKIPPINISLISLLFDNEALARKSHEMTFVLERALVTILEFLQFLKDIGNRQVSVSNYGFTLQFTVMTLPVIPE